MKKEKEAYVIDNGEYRVKRTKWLDIAAIILSILIAFIIWLYAISTNSPIYESSISSINVSVENIPTGLSVISGLDHTIDIKGNGFLYNMVRIIAGTLIYVGEGKISPQDIDSIITSKDRTRSGITAPAKGLQFVEVLY